MFGGGTNIGSANARIDIDLSHAVASANRFRSLAVQIRNSLNQINQGVAAAQKTAATPPTSPTSGAGSAAAAAAVAAKIGRQKLQDEIRLTEKTLAEASRRIAEQQGRFNKAAATAPNSVVKAPVVESLANARQPLIELNTRLAALKTRMAEIMQGGGNPARLTAEFAKITREAANIQKGIDAAAMSINRFQRAATAATTGLQGYFTGVRRNLERINETSLAANLQEISFRLLPMVIAMGAVTKQGIETAMSIEDMTLGLEGFTGSQEKAVALMGELEQSAQRFGLPILEVQQVMQRFLPIIRQSGADMNKVIELAARLRTQNPAEGFSGAMFAITEAMASGEGGLDAVSLRERFGIVPRILREAVAESGNLIDGLDKVLTDMGRTADLAVRFGDTSRAGMQRMSDSWNKFLATAMRPTLDGMTNVSETLTGILDSLQESGGIIGTVVGGFVSMTTAAISALIAVSQVALGLAAIKALMPEGAKAGMLNFFGRATAAQTVAGTSIAPTAAGAVAGGIGTIAGVAITSAVALAIGTSIGLIIANVLESAGIVQKGESDPSSLWNRLKQAIFLGADLFVSFYVRMLPVISNLQGVFELLQAVIQKGGVDLTAVFAGLQAALQNPLDAGGANARAMQAVQQANQSRFNVRDANGNIVATTPAPGINQAQAAPGTQPYAAALSDVINAFGKAADQLSLEFVEGVNEKIARLEGGFDITQAMVDAGNTLRQQILNGLFPEGAPGAGGVGGADAGAGGMKGLSGDNLERAYQLLVNNMIQQTRQAEDEMIAAVRERYDFELGRARALEDFERQRAQALEDFQRDRAGRIEDNERQIADEEADAQKERVKAQNDFNKDEKRRQADHLRDMIRASRDVDDAISARDFLGAQKAIQKMKDDEEDFNTEETRRREDYAAQQQELVENLAEQQAKRRDDFARQLREMDENFARQRQREAQDFALRLAREDTDRALRLAREEGDRRLRNFRQTQDFNLQLATLIQHNGTMAQIWNGGLGVLRQLTVDFWRSFQLGNVQANPTPGRVGSGGSRPTPIAFARGAWSMPQDMLIQAHAREIIIPPSFADSVRSGAISIGGGGRASQEAPVQMFFDLRGSTMNEAQFVRVAEDVIVPKVVAELRAAKRQQQVRG